MSSTIIWWIGMGMVGIGGGLRLIIIDNAWDETLQSIQILGLFFAIASYGHPVVDKIEDAEEEIRDEYEEE